MSLTLGEKLRQAREERGLSISEVAEQTRISPLYLESIENNDYKILPGGIFNKGFVKSYAKHVGVNEQEAMQDYAALMSQQGTDITEEAKSYRPEVLTDESSRLGLLPTLIFSAIILGLIIWGVVVFLKYYPINTNSPLTGNSNTANSANTNTTPTATPTPPISTAEIKVEFKAATGPLSLTAATDGKKSFPLIDPSKSTIFEPKQTLSLSYSKDQAANAQLVINGKQINLPSAPGNPKRNAIELLITKENVGQILQSGSITASGAPTP